MSRVVKGIALAAGILLLPVGGALLLPGQLAAFAASATVWSIATTLATGAFLSGLTAQLSGAKKGTRPNVSVEYAGTVEPRRILYGFNRVSGMHVIPPLTTGTNNKYLHKVLAIAGHQVNAITAVYFDQTQVGTIGAVSGTSSDGLVSTGAYANRAWVRRYLGTASQTADFILDTALSVWTSNHRGRGIAYTAIQKQVDEEVWKTGETQDSFDVEGKLCYDPRLDVSPGANPTSATYKAYTANWALQVADFICDATLGLGEDPARIDWTMLVAAADISDEDVAVPNATTQKRFRGNLVLLTTTPFEDNISTILACGFGLATYSGGKWRIRAGCWETPTFEITDSNVMGPLDLDTAFPYNKRWNGVRGTFIDPANGYQPNEFPAVQSAAYVTADGGAAWKDVRFDGCNNVYEAQRGAIIMTRKSRNWEAATIPCDMSLWKVRPGDTGIATITELGWLNQQVRCESWGFTPDGAVALRVRAENAADWNDPLEADYLTPTAISTPTPVPYTPDPPSSFTASSQAGSIAFSWVAPSLMPSTAEYEIWEYTSSTPFSSATRIWHGKSTTARIEKIDQTTRYYWILVRMPDGTPSSTTPPSTGLAAAAGASNDLGLIARGNCVTSLYTITKSGGASAWDSDCYSAWSYKNGAFVAFRPAQNNLLLMVGLNSDPTTDQAYGSIDYAMYPHGSGILYAYESGSLAATFGSYSPGDDLQVVYDGALVRYLQNGTVLREVMAGPNLQFYLDSSFYDPGATATDIRFGPYGTATPVLFNARGNCVVSDTNAQKVGGSIGWDSDFYSIRGYPSCHVSFKPNQTNLDVIVGLNADPLTDQNYTSIDYSWHCASDGNCYIYESGGGGYNKGTYTTSTVFAITYDGSTITYWKDGVSVRTVSVAGLTLYADASFYSPDAGINSLRFGPTTNLAVADTAQIGDNAATDFGSMAVSSGSFNSVTYSGAPTALDQTIGSSLVYTNNTPVSQTVEVFATCRFSISGTGGGWFVRPKFLGTYPQGSIGGRTAADDEIYAYNTSVTVAAGATATFTLAAHWTNGGTGTTGMTFSYADALLKYNVLKK